jgi:hypothetical protein
MKKALLFLICILIISCTPKKKEPIIKNYKIDLVLYRLRSTTSDTIIGNRYASEYTFTSNVKSSISDTISFIYYHKDYTNYNDTLTIFKNDSVVLREKLHLLGQKKFSFKGKQVLVKKYLQTAGPASNVYINDSLGIVLTRQLHHPGGESFMRWDASRYYELQKAILADTVFTSGKWEFD